MDLALEPRITLRPANRSDLPFVYALYANSRLTEVAAFGWDEMQQAAFLNMQFTARERAYEFQFPELIDEIVILAGSPAGRILTSSEGDALLLVDIVLMAEHQGSGIGTRLLLDLQTKASQSNKHIVLHVDKANLPAIGLYKKLGFGIDDESEKQYSMSWRARVESK